MAIKEDFKDMTDEEIKQMEEIEMKISNQLDEELKKRYDSINARMVYSADKVDILLAK